MSKKEKVVIGNEAIYDARVLGKSRMFVLGIQHMFAMFGATVLVPMITGLNISTTLLFAGLGTLLFHLITGRKVPAFLGSSFVFLGGYAAITGLTDQYGMTQAELLPYACLGVAAAGLVYLILAALFRIIGIEKVIKFFPPVVTGPIIIAIGLGLAGSAVDNCKTNWLLALIALGVVIIFNIWGKGMSRIIPIILGIAVSYGIGAALDLTAALVPSLSETVPALFSGNIDFTPVVEVAENIAQGNLIGAKGIVGLPIFKENTVFAIDWSNTPLILSSIIAIVPLSLATMMEHIGDISAISSTTGKNFIKDPGLHRTLVGDGLATTVASLFGAPANTTYGENTGVLALSKVYDPKVVRIAALLATGVSFVPMVAAVIETIPAAIVGGISFVLYGMISAVGVRNVVEAKVDFTKSRNLIIAAMILVCALGVGSVSFNIGTVGITLTAIAVASLAGIILNAILPGKDYVFSVDDPQDTGVNFAVGQNSEPLEKEAEAVEEAAETAEEAVETAEEAAETAEEAVEAAEEVAETAEEAVEATEEVAETAEEAVEATEEVAETAEEAVEAAEKVTE